MIHSTKEELRSAIKIYFNLKESVISQRKYNSNIESYKEMNNNYLEAKAELEMTISRLSPEEKTDDLVSLAINWGLRSDRMHDIFKKDNSLEAAEILKEFGEAEERLKLYYSMILRSNLSSSALNKSML